METQCPYCNAEMERGYIQSRDGISFTKEKVKVAALSSLSPSSTVLASGGGPFSGAAVTAYKCSACKKIIIDYNE